MTKNFVGQPLSVPLISGIEKFYSSEVMSRFFVQNILSHSAENFRRGPDSVLCFRKVPVAKKFMDKRAGEVNRFSNESFLSQGAENLRGGTLLCVIIFGYRKSLNERVGGGGISSFSFENLFVSQ